LIIQLKHLTHAPEEKPRSSELYVKGLCDDGCGRYGETPQGEKYWIVKNTWSANWGEAGYIRISRDPAYDCGIATQAIYTDIELAD
jgi:cathepsin L